jgi:hypothetical protein
VAALYEKKEITGGCNEFDMGHKHNGTDMRKSKEKVHRLIHCHHRIVLVLQGRACVQQFHHSHEKKQGKKS